MKKIIIPVLAVIAVIILVFVFSQDQLTGTWKCTKYEIYHNGMQKWEEQPQMFKDQFELKLLEDNVVVVLTFGSANQGEYTFKNDTLKVDIKGSKSTYVFEDELLKMVDNHKVRIEYVKVLNKLEE